MSKARSPEGGVEAAFHRRAARADVLARSSLSAADPLRFAAGLYRAQGRLAAAIEARHAGHPLSGRLSEDLGLIVELFGDLLEFTAADGPAGVAAEARALARESPSLAGSRLLAWWSDGRAAGGDYLSRALLRPYVEVLAGHAIPPDRPPGPGVCPFCGGRPWIAARRAAGEGTYGAVGALRLLGCSLCGAEWPVDRIRCPACAEADPSKLPSFRAEEHPAVRIEACETCRLYVKSIDLTVDARAVPEVDDLASLALDLWADGQGLQRIEPGLAGF